MLTMSTGLLLLFTPQTVVTSLSSAPTPIWCNLCFKQLLPTKIAIFFLFVARFFSLYLQILQAATCSAWRLPWLPWLVCRQCRPGYCQWPYSIVRAGLHYDFFRLFALTLKIVVFLLLTSATTQFKKKITNKSNSEYHLLILFLICISSLNIKLLWIRISTNCH